MSKWTDFSSVVFIHDKFYTLVKKIKIDCAYIKPVSLHELLIFFEQNTNYIHLKHETINVFKIFKHDYYYLGGKHRMHINETIPYDLIETLCEEFNQFEWENGATCNTVITLFIQLLDVYMTYQIFDEYLHQLWRPPIDGDLGGPMYQKISNETMYGK